MHLGNTRVNGDSGNSTRIGMTVWKATKFKVFVFMEVPGRISHQTSHEMKNQEAGGVSLPESGGPEGKQNYCIMH